MALYRLITNLLEDQNVLVIGVILQARIYHTKLLLDCVTAFDLMVYSKPGRDF